MNISEGDVLSVPKGFFQHMGISAGGNLVFHNRPTTGETLTTLSEFSMGRRVSIRRRAKAGEVMVILGRVTKILSQPSDYSLLGNNCDHTVTKAVEGRARSPQLTFFWTTAALITLALALTKK